MIIARPVGVLMLATLLSCGARASLTAGDLSEGVVTKMAGKLVEDKVLDGLSVGVLQGDQYGSYHFGTASAAGKPNNLTVYEIGSISKLFTSLLVADAVNQGQISLDEAIDVANGAKIQLPAFQGQKIRWRDMCVHRSGLPRLPSNMDTASIVDPYRGYDSSKAAEFFNDYPLTRKPGQTQEYSNLAVSVLGYLVAENVNSDYETLLRERIAKPLQMDDCTVKLTDSHKKRFALPHRPAGKGVKVWNFADMPGSGGVHASMKDMMRFAKAQLDPPGGAIGEAIELAWKQHTPADGSGMAMGLGWMIHADGMTRWHNGETGGSHSMIVVNRELQTAVILLSNTADAAVDQVAMEMVTYAAMPEPSGSKTDESDAMDVQPERLVGRYQLAPSFVFDVKLKDGRMMVGITNQPTQEVFADSPTRWSYRGVKAQLEFHCRDRGPAYALTLHQNGAAQRAKRIAGR